MLPLTLPPSSPPLATHESNKRLAALELLEVEATDGKAVGGRRCNRLLPAVSSSRPGDFLNGLSSVESFVDLVPARSNALAKLDLRDELLRFRLCSGDLEAEAASDAGPYVESSESSLDSSSSAAVTVLGGMYSSSKSSSSSSA